MFYAEVLINKKIETLDRSFTYEVPPHLIGQVQVGSAVRVPFGAGTSSGIVMDLKDSAEGIDAKYLDGVIDADFIFPADLLELASYIAAYYLNPTVAVIGAMLPRGVKIFDKIKAAKTETYLLMAGETVELRGAKQRQVMEYIAEHGELNQRYAVKELGFSKSAIDALVSKALLRREERPVSRYSYRELPHRHVEPLTLTEDQKRVLDSIHRDFAEEPKPFLLRGVTGSGKTELYLRLVGEALAADKQSIILMPEIALTPQFIEIFESRFAGKVVLMHSRLSEGERRDAWYDANNGSAKVILGARSAIFAPCRDLGLIIIDEEHEDSYEQSTSPRFHARVVAEKRAQQHGALLLLGSATPSMESYERAQNGTYHLLEMDRRVGNMPLPEVEIVDMRRELQEGWSSILSRRLIEAVQANVERGEQTMLFLNRLGFNTFVSCRDCGFVYVCPHCDVTMIYYKARHSLRCNRCNYEQRMDDRCPQCDSKRIRYFGTGTEGLEDIVRRHFPGARIDRLDSDSTRLKGQFDAVFERVRKGETDILIGTRMMAKGWDFPRVTLTGIIAADLMLNFPDFRAAERTFQSITQVAGRSGRGKLPGKVILQTYRPEEPVIAYGGHQDYRAFFAWEREKRATYAYPPFSHLIRVVFAFQKGDEETHESLKQVYALMAQALNEDQQLFGPSPAVYRYKRDEERWLFTAVGPDLAALRDVVKRGLRALDGEKILKSSVYRQVEIDPQHIA